MSQLEHALLLQIKALQLPTPIREFRFAADHVGLGKGIRTRLADAGLKDWRFDLAWPEQCLAVEIEGGAWVHGRHTRGVGFTADLEKYHHAMRLGWTVYRCAGELIRSGEAVELIEKLLRKQSRKRAA